MRFTETQTKKTTLKKLAIKPSYFYMLRKNILKIIMVVQNSQRIVPFIYKNGINKEIIKETKGCKEMGEIL